MEADTPCTPKRLPRSEWEKAADTATAINPVNRPPIHRLMRIMPGFTPTRACLAVLTTKYWGAKGVRLTVAFLDNPPSELRKRILLHMNSWSKTANVSFVAARTDPQVRIARTPGDGHWSYLGTDVLLIKKNEPTMNLDSFTMSTPESEYRRVVRHQTGHTLGFPHEHMRRQLVAKIDEAKAIEYFGRTQGWSPDEVREQILTSLEQSSLLGTPSADSRSIMSYQLPGAVTRDGRPILGGTDISKWDYEFASLIYPKLKAKSRAARRTASAQQQQQQGGTRSLDKGATQPLPPSSGATAAAPAPQPPIAPPDQRRLQAIVRCPTAPEAEAPVTDRFVPGAEHDIRVRIAAKRVDGAVSTPAPFPHPKPGQDVSLDVSIIANGQRTQRTLLLPAVADSEWTSPIRFTVPPQPIQFAVYIEIWYQGRVIQSAALAGTPFDLSIDVSEPVATVAERATAQGSITILDGPLGSPTVLDLDEDAGSVNEKQINDATTDLRTELLAAFLSPPASLADAAGQLTKLAVRGRILYERLAGPAGEYHDDDDWIHVNAFSKSDVPIELIYTHPMPSSDDSVPVCPEARDKATHCGKDCHNRNNADVVCPFGFWATSKIIERRRHVRDRTNDTPGARRKVTPTHSSVVGISLKADEADATSSTRIVAALNEAVTSPVVVRSWQELETAAAHHPNLFVLVTHTIEPKGGNVLKTSLELNGDIRSIHRIGPEAVNPGRQQPGPVVLALGCDTNTLTAGYTDLVVNLHNARAEIVLSALSPIPGKGVADFLERFMPLLNSALAGPGPHRFGSVMLAARRATIAKGDLMALALSATGDADVELTP